MMTPMRRLGPAVVMLLLVGGCVRITSTGAVATPAPTNGAHASGPPATAAFSPGPVRTPTITPRPTPTLRVAATPTPAPTPTATPDDGSVTIDVDLDDSFHITPAKMTVTAGVPIHFVVTNSGATEHTFFIGSDQEQKQREALKGEPGADRFLDVPPGETLTLSYTFDQPGKTIAGCTIPGHYSAGMKASITVKAP